jgi:hypothetical protein
MTVVNVTTAYPSGVVYVLGGSPPGIKLECVLWSLRGKISTKCSTRYKVTTSKTQCLLTDTGSAIELDEGPRRALVQDTPVVTEYRKLALRKT